MHKPNNLFYAIIAIRLEHKLVYNILFRLLYNIVNSKLFMQSRCSLKSG